MKFDFDTPVERRGTNCIKYDMAGHGLSEDVIPLWVADMDFQVAPGILSALDAMNQHGVYGYSAAGPGYYEAVAAWYKKRFGWETEKDWVVLTPGVVFALAMAVKAFTKPGDSVMLNSPVYHPFFSVVETNGRRVVDSPLKEKDGFYTMDFADIEEKIVKEEVGLFILSSPQNPVGRVWTVEELKQLEEICLRHSVLVISDEIHSDFIWEGVHTPLLKVCEEAKENVVVCTAPSKSFNLAGLQCSNIFIPNATLREKFKAEISAAGAGLVSIPGMVATQAAYETGEEWLDAACSYIRSNMVFMQNYLKENLPELKMPLPQGTYLTWVDFRALGLSEEEREDLLRNKAKLWLDTGVMFGERGEGFERFNMATNRALLTKALDQLKGALKG